MLQDYLGESASVWSLHSLFIEKSLPKLHRVRLLRKRYDLQVVVRQSLPY